jgi:hypothetical protein
VVGTYPLVMIPAFAVPLALILHGLSIWQLRRSGRAAEALNRLVDVAEGAHGGARVSMP